MTDEQRFKLLTYLNACEGEEIDKRQKAQEEWFDAWFPTGSAAATGEKHFTPTPYDF